MAESLTVDDAEVQRLAAGAPIPVTTQSGIDGYVGLPVAVVVSEATVEEAEEGFFDGLVSQGQKAGSRPANFNRPRYQSSKNCFASPSPGLLLSSSSFAGSRVGRIANLAPMVECPRPQSWAHWMR